MQAKLLVEIVRYGDDSLGGSAIQAFVEDTRKTAHSRGFTRHIQVVVDCIVEELRQEKDRSLTLVHLLHGVAGVVQLLWKLRQIHGVFQEHIEPLFLGGIAKCLNNFLEGFRVGMVRHSILPLPRKCQADPWPLLTAYLDSTAVSIRPECPRPPRPPSL